MKPPVVILLAVAASAAPRPPIPFAFEETPLKNTFAVHRPGRAIVVRPDGIRVLARNDGERWQMRFQGARSGAKVRPQGVLPGHVNYMRNADRSQWRRDLRCWQTVRYKGIYPGIDVAYYGNAGAIEYDLIVAPGADPKRIRLAFPGLRIEDVTAEGALRFESSSASVASKRPVAYQNINRKRQMVAVDYRVTDGGIATFDVASYDRSRPLVIDPILVYSTYLGGNANDYATAVASDPQGNIYVAGSTQSPDFPTTPNAYQTAIHPQFDVFVTKLTTEGALIYSTYLGGTGENGADALAADIDGNAYVAGAAWGTSPLQPTTPALTPGALSSGTEFVMKLNAAGNSLLYGARFPSPIRGAAADDEGDLFITGEVDTQYGVKFPITPGAFQTQASGQVGYIAKLNPAGTRLHYSTYLGGGSDYPKAIAIDKSGNAYVTGATSSTSFPTLNPIQSQLKYVAFFQTTDGQTWSPGAIPYGTILTAMALDPVDGSIYLGTRNGLLKSTDEGKSWNQVALTGYSVATIVTSPPNSPRNILVSAARSDPYYGSVFRSTDGSTFQDTNFGYSPSNLTVDPSSPNVIYILSYQNIWKSTDGGADWANLPFFNLPLFYAMTVDPHNSSIYVVSATGLLVSSDGGQTFTPLHSSTPTGEPTLIVIDPQNSSTIYIAYGYGISKSTDGGKIFTQTSSPDYNYQSIAFDPNNPSTLYAATTFGVYKSTDGASTWTAVNNGISNTNMAGLVFDSSAGNHIYAFVYVSSDAFVTKLNATGTALIYSTYLGGFNQDVATGIAVDASGNAFIGGYTNSAQFPTTASAVQQQNAGGVDGLVAKISPDGGSLLFSTYFGGSGYDEIYGLALDDAGNVGIAGYTNSTDLPVTASAPQSKLTSSGMAFFGALNSSGSLTLATYLGGSEGDSAAAVTAPARGKFCVVGATSSTDFPTSKDAVQPTRNGFNDAFVSIFDINQ